MIELRGLTKQQREIADQLWSMDTEHEVQSYIYSLPRRMRVQAWVVLNMIIAAELDNYMEVTDEVRAYLSSC